MSTPKRPPGGGGPPGGAARALALVGVKSDDGEHLEVFTARMEDALAWVGEGIISDTKTTFGILWWAQWGKT